MYSLNKIQIIGYVTETPNIRVIPSGASVATINVQVVNLIKNKDGEDQESTSFHSVTLWRGLADITKNYITAWSQIYVTWRLETDSWDDQDWHKKYKTKIVGEDLILLSKKDVKATPPEWSWKITSWLNKVDLLWNVTQDIELRKTSTWISVTSFGIATNTKWKNQTTWESEEKTEFHNVVAWDKIAENLASYVKKWAKVFVSWRLHWRPWETPEWVKRVTTEIIADSVRLLGFSNSSLGISKDDGQDYTASAGDGGFSVSATEIRPEDLPF